MTIDWKTDHKRRAELERLWRQTDPALSTREIGTKLGVSKNSVVGIAGRLGLPARPSPIRRNGNAPAPPSRMARAAAAARAISLGAGGSAPPPPPMPLMAPPPIIRQPVAGRLPLPRCCWPVSGEGRATQFCTAEAVDYGRPYCAEHAARSKPVNR